MTKLRVPSLRNIVSGADRDTQESLRDLEAVLRQLISMSVKTRTNQAYAPPFYLDNDALPKGVLLMRAKDAKSPSYVSATYIGWTWDKNAIRIDTIPGLTVGNSYDLNFLIVG